MDDRLEGSKLALTPEQRFTGDLSRILDNEPWQDLQQGAGVLNYRTKEVEIPDVGIVTLTQYCRLRDLSLWENSMQVDEAGQVTNYSWSRDGSGMESPQKVWQLLRRVEEQRDDEAWDEAG